LKDKEVRNVSGREGKMRLEVPCVHEEHGVGPEANHRLSELPAHDRGGPLAPPEAQRDALERHWRFDAPDPPGFMKHVKVLDVETRLFQFSRQFDGVVDSPAARGPIEEETKNGEAGPSSAVPTGRLRQCW